MATVDKLTVTIRKRWWVPWLAIPVVVFPRHSGWLANFIINHGVTVEPAA